MSSRTKIRLSEQVQAYHLGKHPEIRRALKAALAGLPSGKGDIKPLARDLAGYYRLAVGEHRIIYVVETTGDISCLFAEHRQVVYSLFAARQREAHG